MTHDEICTAAIDRAITLRVAQANVAGGVINVDEMLTDARKIQQFIAGDQKGSSGGTTQ